MWQDPATVGLLTDVLGFLTEDEYLWDFRPWRGVKPSYQQYLPFETTPFTGAVEDVVMFSGGLDSLAGAVRGPWTTVGRSYWSTTGPPASWRPGRGHLGDTNPAASHFRRSASKAGATLLAGSAAAQAAASAWPNTDNS